MSTVTLHILHNDNTYIRRADRSTGRGLENTIICHVTGASPSHYHMVIIVISLSFHSSPPIAVKLSLKYNIEPPPPQAHPIQ